MRRQLVQVAEQLVVVPGERVEQLVEVGGGGLVIADGRGRAELGQRRPGQVVRADAHDDHLGVRGRLGAGQLRRGDLAVAQHLGPEEAVLDRRAAAAEVEHIPLVGRRYVGRVGLGGTPARLVLRGRVRLPGQARARRGRVADHHRLHAGLRPADLARLGERVHADQVVERLDAAQHLRRASRGHRDAAHVDQAHHRDAGPEQLPDRGPLAHRRDRDERNRREPHRDQRLPDEIVLPAGGQLLAERQHHLARPLGPQHLDHLRVDGDVIKHKLGSDRPGELRLRRHHLTEQVEFPRPAHAGVR